MLMAENGYRTDLFNVDGLIYPLVQNGYRTDLFNVDGLIYPLVQNGYRTDLFFGVDNVFIHQQ